MNKPVILFVIKCTVIIYIIINVDFQDIISPKPASANIKPGPYCPIIDSNLYNHAIVSEVKLMKLDTQNADFRILRNLVSNNMMVVEIYTAKSYSLYNSTGELIWKAQFTPGTHSINVSMLAKGNYFFTNSNHTQKISLQ